MTLRNLFTSFYRLQNGYKYKHKSLNNITVYSFSSQPHDREITKELSNMFFAEPVQDLLFKLTHVDVQKAFRKRFIGQNPDTPIYKFMTTAEVEKMQAEVKLKAKEKVQMPPIVPLRTDLGQVLDVNKDIIGFDSSKFVFTDITFGVSDKKRIVVVREPNGILRKANEDERHAVNQIYFPQSGRELKHPVMFDDTNLKPLLENGDYEFILDRACCQFEPDDKNYHRVVFSTYKHVDESKNYHLLESTRHLGPLLFYLAFNKKPDNFLLYCLETERFDDVMLFIQLYTKLNQGLEIELDGSKDKFKLIEDFINTECIDKVNLEEALKNYITRNSEIASKSN
ncbi:PREDICTED: 28S ribosomal protein S22, mitochondrial [Diuraphis noxia]|uniref:28S ribosomal protein S22, mitochondrial n=1 Tax=Diuraphis noxia TaxID=143948 RepID=UPI000763AA45|nr:PREDICTED: 28S ribosomal protein S22, mitochondrial [Diuraphis noxia]